MYIHLGNDIAVNSKDIVGIFDLENTSVGKITREFFKKSTKENRIINVSLDMPKSFVICKQKQNGKEIIYITSLSCNTLLKRYKKNKN